MSQAFYDQAMTAADAPAMLALEDSPWRPLYREAAGWVPLNHDVVDLGCGTGRFLKQLLRNEHYGKLHGVDFSKSALQVAADYVREATFQQLDLMDWQPDPQRRGATSYVCLETLEHLDDELELVRRIPPGHQLVFSVPNYWSETHARWFVGPGEVWEQYGHLLLFRRWSLIEIDDRKVIHVVDSTRRTDSW